MNTKGEIIAKMIIADRVDVQKKQSPKIHLTSLENFINNLTFLLKKAILYSNTNI